VRATPESADPVVEIDQMPWRARPDMHGAGSAIRFSRKSLEPLTFLDEEKRLVL
jgi:hypothetical protein